MSEWLHMLGQNNALMAAYAIVMVFVIPLGLGVCVWLSNRVSDWIEKLAERRKQ